MDEGKLRVVGEVGKNDDIVREYSGKLFMVITASNKFVGRSVVVNKGQVVVEEGVETLGFISSQGYVIVCNILGKIMIDCDDVVIVEMDSKSPYFSAYYKAFSGLSVQ